MSDKFKKYAFLCGIFLYFPLVASAYDNFDCIGSEPLWKLSITEKEFTFKLQTSAAVTLPSVEPKPAENMSSDHIRVFHSKMNSKDAIIIIQKQSCTEGASDNGFDYEGLFITNDKVFHGCCSKKLILSR